MIHFSIKNRNIAIRDKAIFFLKKISIIRNIYIYIYIYIYLYQIVRVSFIIVFLSQVKALVGFPGFIN